MKVRAIRSLVAIFAPVLLGGAAALAVGVLPAAAATGPQIVLPIHISASNPNGMALDAGNWAGTGGGAAKCTSAVAGAPIVVYSSAGAGCAGNFELMPLETSAGALTGNYEILYVPDGVVITGAGAPNGYCVSTVVAVQGTHAQIRACSAALAPTGTAAVTATPQNIWQTFAKASQPTDAGATFQLQAVLETSTTPNANANFLNDKAFGANLSPVISWTSTTGLNQDWLALVA